MPERDPRPVHGHEPGLLQLVQRAVVDAEPARRVAHRAHLLGVVGGRDEQERLGGGVEAAGPAEERLLHLVAHGQRLGERLPPGELLARERRRQLQQRQRVAPRDAEQPRAHRRDRARRRCSSSSRSSAARSSRPPSAQLRQARREQRPGIAVARGQQQRDALGVEAAGDREQHVRRRAVEPVRVVDDAEEAAVVGDVGRAASASPAR